MRKGTYEVHSFMPEDLKAFRANLEKAAKYSAESYDPKPENCRYCHRRLSCPAWRDYQQASVAMIHPMSGDRYPVPDDTVFVELAPRVVELEKAIARFNKLLRSRLETGPLPIGDGKAYALTDYTTDKIDPLKAWALISDELDQETMATCIEIRKTPLVNAIKAKAAKGRKGKDAVAFIEKLSEAGALTKTTKQRKSVVELSDYDATMTVDKGEEK